MSARCHAVRLHLAAHADDELDVRDAIEVETHLRHCSACAETVERHRALSRALRELYPRPTVPPDLAERLRARLVPRRSLPIGALVAASLVLALGAAWLAQPAAPAREQAAGDRAAAAIATAATTHRRADAGLVPLALVSGDAAEVERWLDGRLPFAAKLGAPDAARVTLEGAAIVDLDGRTGGLVRYRMGGRPVSLFVLDRPIAVDPRAGVRVRDVEFDVFEHGGLELVAWTHAPLSYVLVSETELPRGEACASCHAGASRTDRAVVDEFVAAVAGRESTMNHNAKETL